MIAARRISRAVLLFSAALAAAVPAGPGRAGSATASHRVIVDWRTGLALHGFDPVAYFAEGRAAAGLPEIEQTAAGGVWRFRNAGNRAAFTDHPEVYLPRFGGYDPLAVARGAATPGNPLLWLIVGERLYLFHGPESRRRFAADPAAAIRAAEARWPELAETLLP